MTDRQPEFHVTAMPTGMKLFTGVFGGWLMSQLALIVRSLAIRERLSS